MRIVENEDGFTRFKVLFWLLLLAAAFHVGYKIIDVQVDYQRMKDTMSSKAGVAQVLKDEEILIDLATKAKELDLPLKAENFVLHRDVERRKMSIRTAWDVEVHFFGGVCGDLCVHTYHFAPAVEESFMKP